MTNFDQEIMARTAMGEARGVGQDGMEAVMWTGMNRFMSKRWFAGLTLAGTFLKNLQYDCWMPKDPNYSYITNISDDIGLFAKALQWAADVIAGNTPDLTQGSTHYYDSSIAPPMWAADATKTLSIGTLTFYKDVP